jgi:hypothetical protein
MTKPRRHDELTDEQLERYVAEAEAGYDPAKLKPRRRPGHRGNLARIEESERTRSASEPDEEL